MTSDDIPLLAAVLKLPRPPVLKLAALNIIIGLIAALAAHHVPKE